MKPEAEARVHLRIIGRVQGVFYRATAQKAARALALCGWVRNGGAGGGEGVAGGPAELPGGGRNRVIDAACTFAQGEGRQSVVAG